MDTRDRASLNDLLRLLEGSLPEGSRLRWTSPTGLALVLAKWISREGRVRSLWVDAPTRGGGPDPGPRAGRCCCRTPGSPTSPASPPSPGASPARRAWCCRIGSPPWSGLLEHRVQVLVTRAPDGPGEAAPSHLVPEAEARAAQGHGGAAGAAAGDPGGPGLPAHGPGAAAPASSAPGAWWWISGPTTWRTPSGWSSSATNWSG